jgi:hypothetical protein
MYRLIYFSRTYIRARNNEYVQRVKYLSNMYAASYDARVY